GSAARGPVPAPTWPRAGGVGGRPPAGAAHFAESLSPLRRGLDSHVSDGVRRVLGREPRDFGDFVKSAAARGLWRTP
ncbi:NmrA family transcriptional regulator, partial [Streptomyces niveus]